jgi:tRNA G18 (ribose-2'-O)-methylase SpoU
MPLIESPQNSLFKKLFSLTKSKGIKKQQQALVSGEKITQEIAQLAIPSFWVVTDSMRAPQAQESRTLILSEKLFAKLDVCSTRAPLLCTDIPPIASMNQLDSQQATLYTALSDPTNLGALVRTCAAFTWPQIVLLNESAHPFLPKAIRAASGTNFATRFFYGPSINDLQDSSLLALDMKGKKLSKALLSPNLKLLVGEEGQGVPRDFRGQRVTIPISNRVESLNATIATSLLIYEWSQL